MTVLEPYVWCNLWLERTDIIDGKRVLLIGDSITNAYRPVVNEILSEKILVDMLATSRAIDDPCLKYELDYMLKVNQFKYEMIHFNNGLHGWHLSSEQYEECLHNILLYIKSITKAKLIVALSTPITVEGETTKIHEELNNKVIKRNETVLRLSKKLNLAVNDLYNSVYGKSDFRQLDGYHYNEIGQREQAEIVAQIILKNM